VKIKNKISVILFMVFSVFCFLVFFGCGGLDRIYELDDFDLFLASLISRYERQNDVLELEGFTPVVNVGFEFGLGFCGRHTFAVYDDWHLILRDDGDIFRSRLPLFPVNLVDDKFAFNGGGLYGVSSIFGSEIIKANYDRVEIQGNTIAGFMQDGSKNIYYDGVRTASAVRGGFLYGCGVINYNGRINDVYLNPIYIEKLPAMSTDSNGFRVVAQNGLFGFSYKDYIIIAPQFSRGTNFNRYGYASVVGVCGNYKIINTLGEIVISQVKNKRPINFDGTHLVFFYSYQTMAIADKNFNLLTDTKFMSIYSASIFNDDIIIYNQAGFAHRFFSLSQNQFVLGEYYSIQVFDNHFLARAICGRFTLYDYNLNMVLYRKDYISFNGLALMVRQEGVVHYYRIIS